MKMTGNLRKLRLIFSLFFCLTLLFSCSNPSSDSPSPQYNAAVEILKKLGNRVEIESLGQDTAENNVVYFYFTQPIDHNDESKGYFKQYCVLHYKGRENLTVLMTNGYSIEEKNDYAFEDIAYILSTNYIEVEHRYYKNSDIGLAGPYEGQYWAYNTAEQATADLHEIVTALKATSDFGGKWISTGLSKNGILTSMYAYKYPNEVDVYVAFGAPFITSLEEKAIGTYLADNCGNQVADVKSGKTVKYLVWTALSDYLTSVPARASVEIYAKSVNKEYENQDSDTIKKLITFEYVNSLFRKYAYYKWDLWAKYIPLLSKFENESELYAKCFYIFATTNETNFKKNIEELKKIFPMDDSSTQSRLQSNLENEASQYHQSPEKVVEDAYFVQASMELGYYLFDWTPVENCLSSDDIKQFNSWGTITNYSGKYGVTYDGGTLMKGFLKFLENNSSNHKCKMVFVYGENDPWTRAAIPDESVDNIYIKKFLIPEGTHNSYLDNRSYYSKEDSEKIMSAIKAFLN